jgi:hypothetical protein
LSWLRVSWIVSLGNLIIRRASSRPKNGFGDAITLLKYLANGEFALENGLLKLVLLLNFENAVVACLDFESKTEGYSGS